MDNFSLYDGYSSIKLKLFLVKKKMLLHYYRVNPELPSSFSPVGTYFSAFLCTFLWAFSLSMKQQKAMTAAQRKPRFQGRQDILLAALAVPEESPLWCCRQLRSPATVLPHYAEACFPGHPTLCQPLILSNKSCLA